MRAELFACGLRAAPHLHDLGAPVAQLAHGQLALDAGVVEQRERAVRGRAPRRRDRSGGRPAAASASRCGSRGARCTSRGRRPLRRSATRRPGAGRARDRSSRRGASRRSPGSLSARPIAIKPSRGYPRTRWPPATRRHGRLDAEYAALTEHCGLLDRSERGKLALSGADAKAFLAGQVTNDIEALRPGDGPLRGVPDPQGQDARRPAHPRRRLTGRGRRSSCCSTPSAWRCRRCST